MMRYLVAAVAVLCSSMLCAANLLTGDSGYECAAGYFSQPWQNSRQPVEICAPDFGVPEGRRCGLLRIPAGASASITGDKLSLEEGKKYFFSCYIKADRDVELEIACSQERWKDTQSTKFHATSEWQRAVLEIVPELNSLYFLIIGAVEDELPEETRIYFDALQLEIADAPSAFVSPKRLLTGFEIPSEHNRVFFNDEKVTFRLCAADNREDSDAELTCRLVVTDWQGKQRFRIQFTPQWSKGWFEKEVTCAFPLNGLYVARVTWTEKASGAVVESGEESFAVVAHPRPDDPEVEPFGGVSSWVIQGVERIGIRWAESGAYWFFLEPERGVYSFDQHLKLLRELKQRGFKNKFCMVHRPAAPKWAWRPDELAEMEEWGLSPNMSLLPTDSSLKDLERCIEAFVSEAGDTIDLFEIGGEDELICGAEPYYRRKYSEHIFNSCVEGPVCEGLAKQADAIINGVRRGDPDLLIAAGRPSAIDCYSSNFSFSRGVLSQVQGDYALFGMDCYSWAPRYIDAETLPGIANPDRELPGVFERAYKFCAELGNQQPFISEYGYAIDAAIPLDDPLQAEMVWRMSQVVLMSRLFGSPYFYWFNTNGYREAEKYDYGLWHYGRPTLNIPAYSQLLQVVEGVRKYERQLTAPSGLRLGLFGQKDRAILAMWSGEGPVNVRMELPEGARYVDFLGNEHPKSADGAYTAKNMPVYFIVDGAEAYDALKRTFDGMEDLTFPLYCCLEMKSAADCSLVVLSPEPDAKAVLTWRNRRGEEKTFTRENGGYPWRIAITPEELSEELSVTMSDNRGRSRNVTFKCPFRKLPRGTVRLDDFYGVRSKIFPPDPHISWAGAEDFGGVVNVTCDENTLTLEAVVNDDVHCNSKPLDRIWDGDCLQFCVTSYVARSDETLLEAYDSPKDVEGLVAWQPEGGAKFYCESKNLPPLTAGTDYTVERDEKKCTTTYRVTLSRKLLGLDRPNAFCGISCVIFDDDEGGGQAYYYQFSPGITGLVRNPELFPIFLLP